MKEISDEKIKCSEHKGSFVASFMWTKEARETVSERALGMLVSLKRS